MKRFNNSGITLVFTLLIIGFLSALMITLMGFVFGQYSITHTDYIGEKWRQAALGGIEYGLLFEATQDYNLLDLSGKAAHNVNLNISIENTADSYTGIIAPQKTVVIPLFYKDASGNQKKTEKFKLTISDSNISDGIAENYISGNIIGNLSNGKTEALSFIRKIPIQTIDTANPDNLITDYNSIYQTESYDTCNWNDTTRCYEVMRKQILSGNYETASIDGGSPISVFLNGNNSVSPSIPEHKNNYLILFNYGTEDAQFTLETKDNFLFTLPTTTLISTGTTGDYELSYQIQYDTVRVPEFAHYSLIQK